MNCEKCKYFILTYQDRGICKKYAVYVEDREDREDREDCEDWEDINE